MISKKIRILLFLFCNIQFLAIGQSLMTIGRGEKVPDILIRNVSNYPTDSLRLSDFKGQWILIDFWGAGCLGCVSGFPMLDSMQRKYDGKLKILLVSENNQKQLDKFINSIRQKVTIPDVIRIDSDTLLGQLFPYFAVPYHVWIDPEGRFYAGTFSSNLKPGNIERLMKGERPYFKPVTFARYADFTAKSILEEATGMRPKNRIVYSYFTGYVPKGSDLGYESTVKDSSQMTVRYSFSNLKITDIVLKAIPKSSDGTMTWNKIFYELSDPSSLLPPEDDGLVEDWKTKNLYSYEIQLSIGQGVYLNERIREDILWYLKSYAGISVFEAKRKVKVVKVRIPDLGARIKADTSRLEYRLFPSIQKTEFETYFWRPIATYYATRNIFFEKDFDRIKFPVDITVGPHWQNFDSLKAILNQQGIELIEEEQDEIVLVISDRKDS